MPQVRIRNISKEYKLVAGVFSPDLLKVEEGKREEPEIVQEETKTDRRAKKGHNRSKQSKSMLVLASKLPGSQK